MQADWRRSQQRNEFGALLRGWREHAGLTQERLAQRAGLGVRTIRNLERGQARPLPATVRLLGDALGLDDAAHARLDAAAYPPRSDRRPPLAAAAARLPGMAVTPAQLPADLADFTGRAAQVALVCNLLDGAHGDRRAVPVMAVSGRHGAGKSALAVHVAQRLRDSYPQGQLYVNLGGTEAQPLRPARALVRFLRALGVAGSAVPPGLEERAELYRSLLDGRRVLVVLDNAVDERQVRPLLPGSPTCGVLVTSRVRLVGLDGAQPLELGALDHGEAVELLARIVGTERVAAAQDAVDRIAGLCGHLPLALRIAGGRLALRRHHSMGWLAERLADERRRLDELAVGDLEVRASLALSYRALAADQARVLRLLGLLAAPDWAAWVGAALLGTTLRRGEELLDRLVDHHLLQAERDGAGAVRYRFHDLVRAFARERAEAEEPAERRRAAVARALGGWLRLSEAARERLGPGSAEVVMHGPAPRWPAAAEVIGRTDSDCLAWLDAERGALVAAVEQAAELGLPELCWDLAACLTGYFERRSLYDDWELTHRLGLAASRRARNRHGEALLLHGLGGLALYQGRATEGLEQLTAARAGFDEAGDGRAAAYSAATLGSALRTFNRFEEALPILDQAAAAFQCAGDLRGEAYVLQDLGLIDRDQGRMDQAERRLEASLAAARAVGDRQTAADGLRALGLVQRDRGRLEQAATCFEQAEAGFAALGDQRNAAYARKNLADILAAQGAPGPARSMLSDCLDTFERFRDPFGTGVALTALGELDLAGAAPRAAIASLRRAAEVWEAVDAPLQQAKNLRSLGLAYQQAGELPAALAVWRQAQPIFARLGAPQAEELAQWLGRRPPAGRAPPLTHQAEC